MELSNKSIYQFCDMQTNSTSVKLNSNKDECQQSFQSDESANASSDQLSDSESVYCQKSRKVNGIDRMMPINKKLVVQLCDFMVCSKESCDISDYKKYRKKNESKKRKADQHLFQSRKRDVKYKEESSEEDSSDADKIPNLKKVSSGDESFDMEDVSDSENHKKRKAAQHQFHSRKKEVKFKEDSSEEDTSHVDKVSKVEKVSSDAESSDVEEVSESEKHKKRKTIQHQFYTRKREVKYKEESSAEDSSDVDKISNVEKVRSKDESSDIEEVSDSEHEERKTNRHHLRTKTREVKSKHEGSNTALRDRTRKVRYKEEESDEDYSYEDDADDSDWDEYSAKKEKAKEKEKSRKAKEKEKGKKGEENKVEAMSSFELMRKQNLDDKMAFLKSLRMNEIEEDLEEIRTVKKRDKKPKLEIAAEDLRKSKRMVNFKIDLSEQALEAKVYKEAEAAALKPELPHVYPFEDALWGDERETLSGYENFFRNLKTSNTTSNKNYSYNLCKFDPMSSISNLYPFFLSSIDFHPAVDKTIILAGSTDGHISLWNKDTEHYLFAPHLKYVSRIAANPELPSQIISSSYDGTLRQTDLEKEYFLKIFDDDSACTYFDFISPTEFLVAHRNGFISMVDSRDRRSRSGIRMAAATSWKCSELEIRTISAHPKEKNVCLSLDKELLKVWDLRFLGKSSVVAVPTDPNMLSAFFSPVTGKSILASSKLSLRVYGYSHLEEKIKWQWNFGIQHTSKEIVKIPRMSFGRKKGQLKGQNQLHSSHSSFYTMAHWMPNSDQDFIVCNNFLKKVMILKSNDGSEETHLNISNTAVFQAVHPVHNTLAVSSLPRGQFATRSTKLQLYLGENCT